MFHDGACPAASHPPGARPLRSPIRPVEVDRPTTAAEFVRALAGGRPLAVPTPAFVDQHNRHGRTRSIAASTIALALRRIDDRLWRRSNARPFQPTRRDAMWRGACRAAASRPAPTIGTGLRGTPWAKDTPQNRPDAPVTMTTLSSSRNFVEYRHRLRLASRRCSRHRHGEHRQGPAQPQAAHPRAAGAV